MSRANALLGACVLAFASCASPPPPAPLPTGPPAYEGPDAWDHLAALVEIGSRAPGTEGAARARAYVREQLEALGLELLEQQLTLEDRGDGQPLDVTNVVGEIPGTSRDLFLLAAPLDTREFETFEHKGAAAASGPALLLELARLLSDDPLPYTVRLVFLGAEAPQGELQASQALWSSRLLVKELTEEGSLDRVRLAVYFGQVADAELTIARDLVSHRTYRDAFFKAAHRLGHDELFPSSGGFDSVESGHAAFLAARMRRVVVITDPRYGGDQPPGIYHHTEQDTLDRLSRENLDAVAVVSEQALRDVGLLLERVDRFARRRSVDEPTSEPAQEEAPEPAMAGLPESEGAPTPEVAPEEPATGEASPEAGVPPHAETSPEVETPPAPQESAAPSASPADPVKGVESSAASADEPLQEEAPEDSPR
jgi:hypothetical protein